MPESTRVAINLAGVRNDLRRVSAAWAGGSKAFDRAIDKAVRDIDTAIIECTGGVVVESRKPQTRDTEERHHSAWLERQYNPIANKLR